jgi:hypothetical protein
MLETTFNLLQKKSRNVGTNVRYVYQLRDTNYDQLSYALFNANLENIIANVQDIDCAWINWRTTVTNILDKYVKKVKIKGAKTSPWIDGEVIHLSNIKARARSKAIKSNKESDWQFYRSLNNRVKNMVRNKYNAFLKNCFNNIDTNPKKFWGFVNNKGQCKSFPDEMFLNGQKVSDAQSKAEAFSNYFKSQFNNCKYPEPPIQTFINDNLSHIILDVDAVYNALLKLDPNKCNGPDGIPILVYIKCAEVLAPSLCMLFNLSLTSGIVPNDLKIANVIPVYKKGDKSDITNYRPISILPTIEKVFEKCVFNVVYNITKNDLNVNQHGFIDHKSTTTQLIEVYNNIHQSLESNKQFDMAYLDLSKAFDRVPHNLLLLKLKSFGYNGPLLNWFSNYLSHRRQCVVLQGHRSGFIMVNSGVPQGSILGPLMFLYYVNDMFKSVKNFLYLYADDSKIGRTVNQLSDCTLLQDDLNILVSWSLTWGKIFNPTKCVIISFHKSKSKIDYTYKINNVCLENVPSFCDLGVIVTKDLKWDLHVNKCINRANQRLGLVKRTLGYSCHSDIKLLCYKSLIRPLLEFSTQVWNILNTRNLYKKLESVQRRASKYILNDYHNDYRSRVTTLNLLPLSLRKEFLDIVFFLQLYLWTHKYEHELYSFLYCTS